MSPEFSTSPTSDPPFQGELTVIWATERKEILSRLEYLEIATQSLSADIHSIMKHLTTQSLSPSVSFTPKGSSVSD